MIRTKHIVWSLIAAAAIAAAGYYLVNRHANANPGLITGTKYSPEQLNEGDVDGIKDLSLPEAKKRLHYLIIEVRHGINAMARIKNMRLEISLGKATAANSGDAKELDYEEPFVPFPTPDLNAALATLKQQPVQFKQHFFDHQSGLELDVEPIHEVLERGAVPDQHSREQYRIQTVYFRDGTQQPFADVAVIDDDPDEEGRDTSKAELNVNKPVERISVSVTYPTYPGFKRIVLDPARPKVSFDGSEAYELTALADDTASLRLVLPNDKRYVIQGLTADGRTLYNAGKSSSSAPTAEQEVNMRAYYDELLRMVDEFSSFESSAAVQSHLEQFTQSLPSTQDSLIHIATTYRFEDTPASIVIYLLDAARPQTTEWELSNSEPEQERYIAYDNASDKGGFIDNRGQWVVEPRFEIIESTGMTGVYRMQVGTEPNEGDWVTLLFKYFTFLPGGHTLKMLPFDIIEQPINDRLMIVERETNGPYGVYDVKKHQFVIPMEYVSVNVVGNIFTARPGDKTYESTALYGAWSLDGKELLAPRYSRVEATDQFVYATSADGDHKDVYNLQMRKLNPPGATAIGEFVQDQPLLLQHHESGEFSFIDEKGKRLPIKLPFDDVEPFSNGMAVVGRDRRYGAINPEGKLSVALDYTAINPFQENLAAAEMDGFNGLVLIDKNNTVVKKLGSYWSYSTPANSNDAEYRIGDAKDNRVNVFDADGRQIETYERD